MIAILGMDNRTMLLLLSSCLFCLWSSASTISSIDEGDLFCLRSIKSSVKDPLGSLKTWSFDNIENGDICMLKEIVCWPNYSMRVHTITLQGLGLEGKFPQGVRNCTSLTTLDLSNNNFFGTIPSNINQLIPYLTDLNLSYNKFSGEIPSSIAKCVRLKRLLLNENQLTGPIPPQLGQLYGINDLNVANNCLSGAVPVFVSNFATPESYANNKGLCGGPLEACEDAEGQAKFWFIGGFAVGWAVSAIPVTAFFMFICMPGEDLIKMVLTRRKNNRRDANQTMTVTRRTVKKKEPHQIRIPPIMKTSMMQKLATRIPLRDLIAATNNFSEENIIGYGKRGDMYKASVKNGNLAAVKRFQDSWNFEQQFIYEVLILGRLSHPNLVPLLGFCTERNEKLLVYEHMGNGNLYQWLHPHKAKAKILEWPLRARIGIGLARGLAWLHHNCIFLVAHGSISSKCILLDQTFEPLISNFSRATLMKSSISDSTRGLFVGSADTESKFLQCPRKQDVYSFGLVLLEMVTGRKPDEVSDASQLFDGNSVDWFDHILSTSGIYDAIDQSLIGRGFDGEIFQFLKVACSCVKASPHQRPTMLEVYKNLRATVGRDQISDDFESWTRGTTSNNRNEHTGVEITEESIEIV